MITKNDFIHYVKDYMIANNHCDSDINIEEKYNEFVQKRNNSDYINNIESDDARYDAELDLIEEVVKGDA